jgi:hypothetical protein
MVDNPPPPFAVSLTDIQTRLAETTGRWLIEQDGTLTVRLMDLAQVVHELSADVAMNLVNREVAYRYQELAAAMRRSIPTCPPVGLAESFERWAASLERRARALLAANLPGLGGEQR